MKNAVLVSGGAQGIGRITVEYLLEANYAVSLMDVDKEAVEEAKDSYKDREEVQCYVGDVSKEEQVKQWVTETVESFGGLYALVNNAAISRNRPLEELSLEEWNQVLAVNLTSPFLLAKYAAPYLKKAGGVIVNICSTRALMSEPNTEAYSASKGGLLSLTHALALSLGP
ncbi:MAG: SDR family NAD(P)-dependent oxidoreductase, partial [Spirochaetales bacterium]